MTFTAKVIAGLLLIGIVILAGIEISAPNRPASPPPAVAAAGQAMIATDHDAAPFFALYALRPGENFRLIPPPFIAQRWPPIWMQNYQAIAPQIGQDPVVDCLFIKQFSDGTFKPFEGEDSGGNGGGLPGLTVRKIALHLTGLQTWQIDGDTKLLETALPGDVVVRDGATSEQMLAGIAAALSAKVGRRVAFINTHPQRDVVIVSGTTSEERIHLKIPAAINSGKAVFPTRASSQFDRMLDYLATLTGLSFLDETQNGISSVNVNGGPVIYAWDVQPAENDDISADRAITQLLASLSEQTGLIFKHEIRPVDVWTLAPAAGK